MCNNIIFCLIIIVWCIIQLLDEKQERIVGINYYSIIIIERDFKIIARILRIYAAQSTAKNIAVALNLL